MAGGELVREESVPEVLLAEATARREELIDTVSLFSDSLTEAVLEGGEITPEMIREAVRLGTLERKITPVFVGSAYKNKGVQPLLDAVTQYLPCPAEIENTALDLVKEETPVRLTSSPDDPVVALAFKLEDGHYGQLTYIRVYQGTLARGETVVNSRDGKKLRIGRLVRMHADQMEDIEAISAAISAPSSAWNVNRETPLWRQGKIWP